MMRRQAGVAVYVHAAWSTWDRLPLLTDEIQRRVHRAIAAKCAELGAEVVALGGVEDHVHLLIKQPPALALSYIIGQVKGASSHLANHDLPPNGPFFKWQGAFGADSISPSALGAVSAYIANQEKHHREQSIIPEWEPHLPR
jgi:REP element-mobilizing transposase RayT